MIYWSCIVAARWDSLKNPLTRATDFVCLDLPSAPPLTEPDHESPFGALFYLLQSADQRRNELRSCFSFESCLDQSNRQIFQLLGLLAMFLAGEAGRLDDFRRGPECQFLNLNPFNHAIQIYERDSS
jgi:hypothetical protein